jgi:hypothetical protein
LAFTQPQWDGSELKGRTIFIFAEQGLGDTMQFVRYLPLVQQRGGRVVFQCQSGLKNLLSSAQGFDCLVPRDSPPPPFDIQAPLASLPGIFRTSVGSIPSGNPYLEANPQLVQHWRRELASLSGFKIGIAWQGSPTFRDDRRRSIPLACFAPLARGGSVQLINLQKGPGTDQLPTVAGSFQVHHLGNRVDEASGAFMDTAAIMKNLDLVITSDTATAHLAGALGVPVWTALPMIPDWRWLLQRDNSPWYPTMRLFRQTRPGQWPEVFERMAQEIDAGVNRRSA